MPSIKLLAKIHIAKKDLGFDDETYRGLLYDRCGKRSAKELSDRQIVQVIRELVTKGWNPKQRKDTGTRGHGDAEKKKYEDQKGDIYSATPAQKRMIEAMWHDLYRGNDEVKHLRQFLFCVAKVNDMRFLEVRGAHDVIEALKAMQNRKEHRA
jgi:phage gp16-like protein